MRKILQDSGAIETIIFWGASGQAKVMRDCLRNRNLTLLAVFDNNVSVGSPFPDVPIHHGEHEFDLWLRRHGDARGIGFLVTIGGGKGYDRVSLQEWLRERGLIPIIAVHHTAVLATGVQLGSGSQVHMNATIGVDTTIDAATIINSAANIDHECRIGKGVHVAPGACLGGCVTVEDYAFIGIGAAILPRITIGSGAIVGAGAVVTQDVAPNVIVSGIPARIHRNGTL